MEVPGRRMLAVRSHNREVVIEVLRRVAVCDADGDVVEHERTVSSSRTVPGHSAMCVIVRALNASA